MSVDLEKFRTCVAISDDELVLEMAPDIIAEVELLRSEIASLRDELTSTTRHMELAEAAWLRETAGNSPISSMSKQAWQLVHDNERLRDEIARLRLTEVEREAVATATPAGVGHEYARRAATLHNLLERLK